MGRSMGLDEFEVVFVIAVRANNFRPIAFHLDDVAVWALTLWANRINLFASGAFRAS